ncbi:L-alanine-DL-glutamate epimerase-like enolase superfamily enzyme [Neolewinella xylanilytica]|uniref:Dipeptide epimerase n=1 Tax=Neolewinella xylanilytica TaxID=1514080 RepID=A0A2S6I1T6_9BACT|nr:dipeptide epimerase [Neolewinella xylanilytica]PPK85113.1 L-alanine-DL-glutamate epimerase-like enolase superfamily enzyme [Neolewinella xylanilytica]
MQLTVHPFDLPLRDAFRTTHESRTVQPTLIVRIHADGLDGLGEAPMTRYYGLESQRCKGELEAVAPALAALDLRDLARGGVGEVLKRIGTETLNPFLRCALDVALHDLWAKQQGKRLGLLWDQDRLRRIPTCYTIGLAPIEEMVRKLRAFPWPVYKIKLGGGADDLDIIRKLREHTDAPFYVDANTGWTARQAIELSGPLRELGVVFIEQPLPTADRAGQAEVIKHAVLPVLADESCQTEGDVEKCAGVFSGINIKIVKCGGLLPARRMIARARSLGLQVMAGCMTESSVGISAIAQLLPELDYADMDGAMLLAEDPARGVTFDPLTGYARYPDEPGTGAVLKVATRGPGG